MSVETIMGSAAVGAGVVGALWCAFVMGCRYESTQWRKAMIRSAERSVRNLDREVSALLNAESKPTEGWPQ